MKSILKDLNKDISIYSENRYWVKRYSYKNFNYVDSEGKKIDERFFSFILMHGNKWDNSTHLDIRESELDQVIPRYQEILLKKRAERKALLSEERSMRKQFPRHTQVKFNNVTITVVEDMAYTSVNAGYGSNGYPLIDSKKITIYANENPYRYCIGKEYKKDFKITTEWVFEQIATHFVAKYNTSELSSKYHRKPFTTKVLAKFDYDFVPYHFFLGYVVEIDGKEYTIRDVFNRSFSSGFVTDKGDVEYPAHKLNELSGKVLSEAGGTDAWVSLLNKFKYCE